MGSSNSVKSASVGSSVVGGPKSGRAPKQHGPELWHRQPDASYRLASLPEAVAYLGALLSDPALSASTKLDALEALRPQGELLLGDAPPAVTAALDAIGDVEPHVEAPMAPVPSSVLELDRMRAELRAAGKGLPCGDGWQELTQEAHAKLAGKAPKGTPKPAAPAPEPKPAAPAPEPESSPAMLLPPRHMVTGNNGVMSSKQLAAMCVTWGVSSVWGPEGDGMGKNAGRTASKGELWDRLAAAMTAAPAPVGPEPEPQPAAPAPEPKPTAPAMPPATPTAELAHGAPWDAVRDAAKAAGVYKALTAAGVKHTRDAVIGELVKAGLMEPAPAPAAKPEPAPKAPTVSAALSAAFKALRAAGLMDNLDVSTAWDMLEGAVKAAGK